MSDSFIFSSSPHTRSKNSTTKVMLNVIIALVPAIIASVIFFGIGAIIVCAVSVASCLVFEFIWNIVFKKKQSIKDLTAVITGILLALNMPVTIPLYLVVLGAFVSIIVVKMIFGGLGQNFLNPALSGRLVLFLLFQTQMSNWVEPMKWMSGSVTTGATPLITRTADYIDLFLGNVGGSMGETSTLAILIGFAFLLFTGTVKPTIPLSFIGAVAVFSLAVGENPLYAVLSGGVMLGAVFMATDYSTSTTTTAGSLIFGIGAGMITVLIRSFGPYPEGVSIAILLMNVATLFIRNITIPRPFGGKNEFKSEKTVRMVIFGIYAAVAIGLGIFTIVKMNTKVTYATEDMLTSSLGTAGYEELAVSGSEIVIEGYENAEGTRAYVGTKRGFDGEIFLLVTLNSDGSIAGVTLIENPDGLGGPGLETADFYNSFDGENEASGDVVAGVTISSNSVMDIINEILAYSKEN